MSSASNLEGLCSVLYHFVELTMSQTKVHNRQVKKKVKDMISINSRAKKWKEKTRKDETSSAERELSGCDLGKLKVNIYFPLQGLSVVTWWIHHPMSSNTHCCYSKTSVPLVFMVAWLPLRQTSTQCKHRIRYLQCGHANTHSQPHTHMQAGTDKQQSTRVS